MHYTTHRTCFSLVRPKLRGRVGPRPGAVPLAERRVDTALSFDKLDYLVIGEAWTDILALRHRLHIGPPRGLTLFVCRAGVVRLHSMKDARPIALGLAHAACRALGRVSRFRFAGVVLVQRVLCAAACRAHRPTDTRRLRCFVRPSAPYLLPGIDRARVSGRQYPTVGV